MNGPSARPDRIVILGPGAMGCGLSAEQLSHAHTLASAEAASADALRLVSALLPRLEGLA